MTIRRPWVTCLVLVLLGACGGDPGAGSAAAGTTTSAMPSTTAEPTTTTTEAEWPPALATMSHGGKAWAVYLAVDRGSEITSKLRAAEQKAAAAGYRASIGDVGCDGGARQALGLDADRPYFAAAVYFASEADARRFVDRYEPGVVGTAEIEAYCAD